MEDYNNSEPTDEQLAAEEKAGQQITLSEYCNKHDEWKMPEWMREIIDAVGLNPKHYGWAMNDKYYAGPSKEFIQVLETMYKKGLLRTPGTIEVEVAKLDKGIGSSKELLENVSTDVVAFAELELLKGVKDGDYGPEQG